jgi:amino acid adenylation domain-containing protein
MLDASSVVWSYNAEVLPRGTVERIAANFEFFLDQATAARDVSLASLPIVEPVQALALRPWNETARDFPDKSVDVLIAEQAARTPDKIAIELEGEQLTYKELERRADAFAARIAACDLPESSIIGVLMERSLEIVVAFLGIMKSGHCYLPLDPNYPEARVHFMIEDSAAPLIVTQAALATRVPAGARSLLFGEDATALAPPRPRLDPGRRCYIIYTSGSTGTPKGVQITHRNLANLLLASDLIAPAPDECFLCVTTFSFDIVWFELWCPLIRGGRVSLVSHETSHDGEALREVIRSTRVTVLFSTPSRFRMMLDAGLCADDGVKVIVAGGEVLPAELARALQGCAREVWNFYGPTEVTIYSAVYRVESVGSTVPIGKPPANTSLYILDSHRHQLPIGVVGELYIGGAQVAIGYLDRESLTAERFLVVSGLESEPVRVYRTGDLCYRRADGNVEYVARADNQIKLRGFRIELGEIEAAVRAHPGVGDSVVIVSEAAGGQLLVAYVASRELDVDELRASLTRRLPPFMVPSHFVVLDALPLGPTGKLDRKALPPPRIAASDAAAFDGETQRRLAVVWSELLQIDVGPHDEFRSLGGNSLLMARLAARIRREFSTTIGLRKLTEAQTVVTMAALLDASMMPAAIQVPPRRDARVGEHQTLAQRWRQYRAALLVGLVLAALVAVVARGGLAVASKFVLPVPESDPVMRLSFEGAVEHFDTAVQESEPTAIVLGSSDISQGFSPPDFDDVFAKRGQRQVTYSYGFQGSSPDAIRTMALALRLRFEAAGKRARLAVLGIDPRQLIASEEDEKWGDWQSAYVATPALLWQLFRRHPLDAVGLGLSRVFVGTNWRYSIWSGLFVRITDEPSWWFGTRVPVDAEDVKFNALQERLSQQVWNPALRGLFDVGATTDPEGYKAFVAKRLSPERRKRVLRGAYPLAGKVDDARLASLAESARDLAAISDRVVLVSLPVNPFGKTTSTPDYEELLRRVRAEVVGTLFDMRFDPRFEADDFINFGHVTYFGAQKFSRYFAEAVAASAN